VIFVVFGAFWGVQLTDQIWDLTQSNLSGYLHHIRRLNPVA